MSNFMFNYPKELLWDGGIIWPSASVGSSSIYCRIYRTGTSIPTTSADRDALSLAGFVTSNVFDGSGYADTAVTGRLLTRIAGNILEVIAGNVDFGTLGACSSGVAIGCVFYKQVSASDAQRIPIFWYDSGFPLASTPNQTIVRPNVVGLLQM